MDLGQLVRPRRRDTGTPSSSRRTSRSAIPSCATSTSPRATRRAPTSSNWTYLGTCLTPSRRSGLGRLHHLDRLGDQGPGRALASVLHRRQQGRTRALSAHRPRHRRTISTAGRASATGFASISSVPTRLLRVRARRRALARPGDARPLGDARSRGRRLADVLHRPRPRHRRTQCRRRHRLRDLARSLRLDAARSRSLSAASASSKCRRSFEIGSRWYCLFCTVRAALVRGLPALVPAGAGHRQPLSDRPTIRADPGGSRRAGFLDGSLPCRRYAARMLETDSGWVIIGFADKRRRHVSAAICSIPSPSRWTSDGLLRVAAKAEAAE